MFKDLTTNRFAPNRSGYVIGLLKEANAGDTSALEIVDE